MNTSVHVGIIYCKADTVFCGWQLQVTIRAQLRRPLRSSQVCYIIVRNSNSLAHTRTDTRTAEAGWLTYTCPLYENRCRNIAIYCTIANQFGDIRVPSSLKFLGTVVGAVDCFAAFCRSPRNDAMWCAMRLWNAVQFSILCKRSLNAAMCTYPCERSWDANSIKALINAYDSKRCVVWQAAMGALILRGKIEKEAQCSFLYTRI